MSRYDLEEALRDFITSTLEGSYADEDHEHDNNFEDKVYEYLGDRFTVGGGCNVQRAFETSVRAVVADYIENASMHEDGLVRGVLRSILAKAREMPSMAALPILAACCEALQAYHPPITYQPYDTSNGSTPERIDA